MSSRAHNESLLKWKKQCGGVVACGSGFDESVMRWQRSDPLAALSHSMDGLRQT